MGEKRIRTHKRSSPEKRAARKNGIFRMVTAIIAISFEIFLITNLFTRLNAEADKYGDKGPGFSPCDLYLQ